MVIKAIKKMGGKGGLANFQKEREGLVLSWKKEEISVRKQNKKGGGRRGFAGFLFFFFLAPRGFLFFRFHFGVKGSLRF